MLAWLAWPIAGRTAAGATEIVAGSLAQAEAMADARGLDLDWQINGEDHAPGRTPLEDGRMRQRAYTCARRVPTERRLLRQGHTRCLICKVVEHADNFDADLGVCNDCVARDMGWRFDAVDGFVFEGGR
jgi:hypothetical protein